MAWMSVVAKRFLVVALISAAALGAYWLVLVVAGAHFWPVACPDDYACGYAPWERGKLVASFYSGSAILLGLPFFVGPLLARILLKPMIAYRPGALAVLGAFFGFIQGFFVSVLTRLQIGDIGSFEWEIVVGLEGSAMMIGAVVFAAAGLAAGELDRRILPLELEGAAAAPAGAAEPAPPPAQ